MSSTRSIIDAIKKQEPQLAQSCGSLWSAEKSYVPHFKRSSSMTQPFSVYSRAIWFTHLRNCTARSEFTLKPTAMIIWRL